VLGRLFDTVGRKPMITLTYVGSAVVTVVLAVLFVSHTGDVWTFIVVLATAFFLASSGASGAFLTVSEIFPMETRALAIAFFYAAGTAVGGISGPLVFGQLINSGQRAQVAWSFLIGAVLMAGAGLVEHWFGIACEQRSLEELALPLTMAEVDRRDESASAEDATPAPSPEPEATPVGRSLGGPRPRGHGGVWRRGRWP